MNIIIVCVLSAIQVFSSLSSPERGKRGGEESLLTFVITSFNSDCYILIYINRSLIGMFTL